MGMARTDGMRALRRLVIILVGLLAVLGLLVVGGWWWLNRYVEGPEFSALVKKESSRLLGVPVEFKKLIWDVGRGLTLNELDLRHGDKAPAQGEFKAEQIILKYDWATLLERRFEITRFTIKQPVVVIGQDANGNYVLPIAPPTSTASTAPAATKPSPAPSGTTEPLITFAWRSFNLEKGLVEVKNSDGSRRLYCSGIEMDATALTGDKKGLKGSLSIGEIWLLQKVKITSVHSPMRLEGDLFSMSTIEGETYGGRIGGSWEQNFADPKQAYNLKLNLDDCDVNALLSGVVQQTGLMSGRLDAKTLWLGPATDPMAVSGKGTIEVHNGQLINVPIFRTLGQLLGVSALSQPDYSEGKVEFTVADQVMTLSKLQLKSALFELSGTGTIGFDSALKMECRVDLHPDLVKQLPPAIAKSLESRENGYGSLPFKLGGTLNQPKVELVITSGMVEQATDLLKGLFGKKNKTEKAAEPAPATPAPATSTTTTSETVTTSTPVAVPAN